MPKKPDPVSEEENSEFDDLMDEGEGGSPDLFDFGSNPAPAPTPAPAKKNPKTSAPAATTSSSGTESRTAGLAADVPVQLVAVMGKKTMTVKEILSIKKGQVLELNRFPNEAIDIVVGGKLMAKGELVEVDGKLGVRIIKIFE